MKLLSDLHAEHDLIEKVIGSLQTFGAERARGAGDAADGRAFLRFFRLYAGRYHHAREENSLFPALVEPPRPPPTAAPSLRSDCSTNRLRPSSTRPSRFSLPYSSTKPTAAVFATCAHAMAPRFRRACITELVNREPDAEEDAARVDGERLVATYAPSLVRDVLRGDGCVSCPSFGDNCQGVELEWWNELEWEDVLDRIG